MNTDRYLRSVEFVLWVGAASGAVVLGSLALGLLIGRDLVTGKFVMFVAGFLLFGVGSLLIQPSRPTDDLDAETTVEHRMGIDRSNEDFGTGGGTGSASQSTSGGGGSGDDSSGLTKLRKRFRSQRTHQHRYEARLQEVGPLADHELPFERRIGRGWKLFVTGLVVLAVSFVLETGLGVTV
ncbi:hypothetical protein ACKVMT_13730 [Halobacteriales archaeon Cl-PHB]